MHDRIRKVTLIDFKLFMLLRARCLLYSHHIRDRSKIKALSRLSENHGVNGVFKIGKPGYIFLEGNENAVRESVKSIKERSVTVIF
jgi:hypothetical protein